MSEASIDGNVLPPLEERVRVLYGNEWVWARRTRYENSWRWYSTEEGGYLLTDEVTQWVRP